MRKYFQITIVLGSFFFLVFLRSLRGDQSEAQPTINQTPSLQNQPPTTSAPASSPVPASSTPPISSQGSSMMPQMMGVYKNGTYTGSVADAYYGYIQVQAVIQNGRIADVIFLQYPNDNGTSLSINSQAMPLLKQEALQAQSAQVDIISGASDSSMAFQQSLASALLQAK